MFEPRITIWPFFYWETAEQRSRFITRVYFQLTVYLLAGLLQWALILGFLQSSSRSLILGHKSTFVLTFMVSMLLFLIFFLSDELRRMAYMDCFLTIVIVEGIIISTSLLTLSTDLPHLLIGFVFVIFLMVVASMLALLMPYDMTMKTSFIFWSALVLFAIYIYAFMLFTVLHLSWTFWVYALATIAMWLLFLVYHAQCIFGTHYVQVDLRDAKLASLVLFHDFMAMFLLTFYVKPKLTGLW